jgi:hypothetical protein
MWQKQTHCVGVHFAQQAIEGLKAGNTPLRLPLNQRVRSAITEGHKLSPFRHGLNRTVMDIRNSAGAHESQTVTRHS